jgi:secreted trypsin-like serine protease
LEQSKAEAARILEVVKTNNPDKAATNLKFLIDTGLISDQNVSKQVQAYLDTRKPGEGVTLPTNQDLPSSTPTLLLAGAPSSVAEWPWLVLLLKAGHFICNGTLIAPRMVLTTASCVTGREPNDYEVATATDDRKSFRIDKRIPVIKATAHPAFSVNTFKNDIAILELGIELPPPFAKISAPRAADKKVGVLAVIGIFDFNSEPNKLTQSATQIADDATCARRFRGVFESEGFMCVGSEFGRFSVCSGTGSAGAPLVVFNGESRKYQIGILSLGERCGPGASFYGVYTRVSFTRTG